MKKILTASLALCLISGSSSGIEADGFDWAKATVYFVITDRFCNGDPSNDVNYGRKNDYGSERLNAATFHGGDFKGMLVKAREGYFTNLGVDVVWMTDIYEQIHGWMSGSGSVNDFPHYGYHGYYPLDYTQIDKNYGTVEEFRELVDELHSQGIRVMLGANLNNPGYPTLLDARQLEFAATDGIEDVESHHPEWSYDEWSADMADWKDWWTSQWLRTPDESWNRDNPLTTTLYGMPDFKTEKNEAVKLPEFLKRKWCKEGSENDAWVNPSAVGLRVDRHASPANYVISWIASWVREFGIDGFRCDIVEYVHPFRWRELKDACDAALESWREEHRGENASSWTSQFYLTGDCENAWIDCRKEYASLGFSSLVNFYFPKRGDLDSIVNVWQAYSDSVNAHDDWHPFSYLNNSYNRDADSTRMDDCLTTLLLAPGAVQLFYGDESGRGLSDARLNVDSAQSFRSDMNWNSLDTVLLAHASRLGKIRQAHPAVGCGRQISVDAHTCLRYFGSDSVLIAVAPVAGRLIPVGGAFADGDMLKELYSGRNVVVKNGMLQFNPGNADVAVFVKSEFE